MKVSVVIPCRNAATTLGAQLEALCRQEWAGEWEVVVADNASTDGSRQVAESFRGRLPALRVVDASGHSGPGGSRNAGALAATGDALAFCDADDEVAPGWLAAMARALAEHELVAARYEMRKLNPPWLVTARGEHQHEGLNPYTYPPYLPHAGGGGLGVRRSLHLQSGGFDETLPALEDTDYCWRLQRAGVELSFVSEAVVHVRYRQDLSDLFRQTYRFGLYNVLIYRRYRPLGMPRLPWWLGLAKWGRLVLGVPSILWPGRRAAWLHQLAWRSGRLVGSLRYRVWGL